jgi:hypothetical protein
MDIEKLVKQLKRERDLTDQAIVSIESIPREGKRPRGRPPGWMKKSAQSGTGVPQPALQMRSGSGGQT